VELGQTAVKELRQIESSSTLEYAQLDIADDSSIEQLAKSLKAKHSTISVLVNNAGIAFKGSAFDSDVVRTTVKTNYYGTRNISKALLPIIADRIVNVSSTAGELGTLKSEALKARFRADDLTMEGLDALMQEFQVRLSAHLDAALTVE
jgi:carbonyl reductase 1